MLDIKKQVKWKGLIEGLSKGLSTEHISEGSNLLVFLKAESHIDHQHKGHHPVKVCHSEVCTEHPAVDGEHPGAKYEKSENGITDYLTHEDNKVFYVQSLIFVGVPEKFYCVNEKYLQSFKTHIQIPDVKTRESKAKETQQNGDILPVYQLCQ